MFLAKLENILLFLTILLLPTQLGRHFWPHFSYIYSLKIDYLSPVLYFWDILVFGLLLVWFLQKPKVNRLALNLFLFFLFTQVLSLIGSSNIGAGLVRLEQYVLAGIFGIYIASVIPRSAVADRGNLDISVKIATHSTSLRVNFLAMTKLKLVYLPLGLGITVESVIAFLQFFKNSTLGLWILGERSFTISTPGIAKFDFYGFEFLRPYGTFPHPNVLAGFMLISIVILYNLLVIARREPSTDAAIFLISKIASPLRGLAMTILRVSILTAGLTILLTMSRTTILAGGILVAVLARRKWLLIAIVLLLILSPVLFTRFSSLLSFDSLTLLRREELVGTSWQMFLKSPVFGIGLNNFIPVAAGNLISGPSRFLQPVHNIFLLSLSETGIMGLVGLLCLIGFPILSSLFSPLSSPRMRGSINNYLYGFPIRPGMTIVKRTLLPWAIIIFLGMFDHYFLTLPQGYRLLFLVWGMSFSKLK